MKQNTTTEKENMKKARNKSLSHKSCLNNYSSALVWQCVVKTQDHTLRQLHSTLVATK